MHINCTLFIVYMKYNNDNNINNDNSNNNDHDDNNKIVLKFCYRFLTAERERVEELLAQNVQGSHMKIAFSNNEFKELFLFQNIM